MRSRVMLAALLAVGCSVDPDPVGARCAAPADCGAGQTCARPEGLAEDEPGFCVGATDAQAPGDACVPTGPTDDCTPGDQDCDGEVDEDANLSSPASCGTCGRACEDPTPLCETSGGMARCVADCPGGAMMCGESCVDVMQNEEFCGDCVTACDSGEACLDGMCRCGANDCNGVDPACCGGSTCVDRDNDPMNCGSCGRRCPTGASCADSICNCGDGVDCHGACVGTRCAL